MNRRTLVLSLLLILVLALAACAPVAPSEGQAGPVTHTLGVAQPFTGPLGSFGTDFGKGWDILGQHLETPIHQLFGGPLRKKLRLYANINRHVNNRTPDGLALAARQAVGEGFTAI